MAVDVQQLATDDSAYVKQSTDALNAKQSQEALQGGEQPQPSFLQKWVTGPMGRVTTSMMDSAVSAADALSPVNPTIRVARDAVTGGITGVANTVDAAVSGTKALANGASDATNFDGEDTVPLTSPIWDHAKSSILDFRDAVAVKDPTLSDNLVQGAAQLAIPFAGYSRALAGLHGFANLVGAGAVTDATALGPHDPRMADLLALGRHTEGKFGEALRTMAPDGSAVNAYINYLTDRGDESEAEGRFKNVLDGFGTNMVVTPLFHAVASGLKWGIAGLQYAMENGVPSVGSLVPANQQGMVAFHGTRANIPVDEGFSNEKLLSGEGTNAFGAGHYFAENPATAGVYARRGAQFDAGGTDARATAARTLEGLKGDKQATFVELNRRADTATDPTFAAKMRKAAQLVKSGGVSAGEGNLYSVDIPDERVAKMVDWDAPLSEQPPKVQEVFAAHGIDEANMTGEDAYKLLSSKLDKALGGADEAYQRGSGGDRAASALLNMRGVPGIHFLDKGSRAAGGGTRNLVLFNGKDARIISKNGKSTVGQERTSMDLSKEERAAERERVAALRDKEEGAGREFTPEPIPRRAAEHEGTVARRMTESDIPSELREGASHDWKTLSSDKKSKILAILEKQ